MTFRKLMALTAIVGLVILHGYPILASADDAATSTEDTTQAAAPAATDVPTAPDSPSAPAPVDSAAPTTTPSDASVPNTTATTTAPADATSTAAVATTAPETLASASDADTSGSAGANADIAIGVATDTDTTGPVIKSGTAVALANILNIVNTNVVNSAGAIIFENLFGQNGAIDFRNASTSSDVCSLLFCGDNVTFNLTNNAFIGNELALSATSGNNEIASSGGIIDTGNAYAGLNLVNVANANIVDSNYLLVTLNSFGDVNGDIVFPSLSKFFSTAASTPATVNLAGDGTVENDIGLSAESGLNMASTTDATISTGDATSSSNVFNQLNSSLIGGGNVMLLFKIHGNWVGSVYGTPAGLSWSAGDDGSLFLINTATSSDIGSSNITGTSTSLIKNDVSVTALTGENKVDGGGTALITTGNAYAGANVVNIANANVVGKNWILAIVNIFGDWHGNLSFGMPDLWMGEQIETPPVIENGADLLYKFTVINNGDAPADTVAITDDYDASHIDIATSSLPYRIESGHIVWDIGTIPPSGAVEVTYAGTIKNAPPGTDITDTVTARETETDNNLADNTDTATVTVPDAPRGGGGGGGIVSMPLSSAAGAGSNGGGSGLSSLVSVVRDTATTTLLATTTTRTAHEKVALTNISGSTLSNITLHDILRDPSGAVMHDDAWPIGSIAANEEVDIAYDLSFATTTPWGDYFLSTVVTSSSDSATFKNNGDILLLPPPIDPLIPHLPTLPIIEKPTAHAVRATNHHAMIAPQVPETGNPPTGEVAAAAEAHTAPATLFTLSLALGGLSVIALRLSSRKK